MTTSQKNAIYYRKKNEEDILREAVCASLGLSTCFRNSKYVYLSNFLKYQHKISVSYHTVFCSGRIGLLLYESLPAFFSGKYKIVII